MKTDHLPGTLSLLALAWILTTTLWPRPGCLAQEPASPGVDRLGIPMLYPSRAGGEEWSLPADPNNDSRIGGEGPRVSRFLRNEDGTWKIRDQTKVRHSVLTSRGYRLADIETLSQRRLTQKGYMMYPEDWKNVEGYAFYRINEWSSSSRNGPAHVEFVLRGGHSTDSTTPVGGFVQKCEATSYHLNFYPTGRAKYERDNMHTAGYTTNDPQKQNAFTFQKGKWIGYKVCLYNLPGDHHPYPEFVKLESYVTEPFESIQMAPSAKWRKVFEYLDQGGWKVRQSNQCDGNEDHIISWGGPCAVLRSDNLLDYDIGPAGFREIPAP
jgi:hypothetical protein